MKPLAVIASAMQSPFGDADATYAALIAGRDAFAPLECAWLLRNDLVAVLPNHPQDGASWGAWQRQLGVEVGRQALEAASADRDLDLDKCGCVFATSFGHLLDQPGQDTMSTWASDCASQLGFTRPPFVAGSGCSSGADAIALAAALLDRHCFDTILVVAVDIVTPGKRLAHSLLGTMTSDRVRPFDLARSGMLIGEAAGALLMQRSEGPEIAVFELLGVGAANDASGLTAPDQSGLSVRLAIERALLSGSLDPQDIAVYLAHGTGTELNDLTEAKVVAECFTAHPDLVMMAVKGSIGHSLGACGLVEFLLLLQALRHGKGAPIAGLSDPLASVADRLHLAAPSQLKGQCGISVKLGFGGFNSALIARVNG
ncbi:MULTISPECIES: beta-ketoacyl synthase N-terminal-like domain-containing protein [unclassified Novosphingobium]|uniref:beta-ketoacyl synthase N-terminal-like domain-containing protein n=1 Tax=unclassified Novosphingobium TaxID=2644732 RepID=UPI0025E394F2|nr:MULTISPECIES: beta-ketoacyl synthase N-terminal-like domain-containing protein [unclassified Novosphingobium]HQV04689.1 beta-ketoacyl synthase N-terminal-like domain-containing protein [Novosphingobium sp.]